MKLEINTTQTQSHKIRPAARVSGHPAVLGIPPIPPGDPGGNGAAAQGEAARDLQPIGEEEPIGQGKF